MFRGLTQLFFIVPLFLFVLVFFPGSLGAQGMLIQPGKKIKSQGNAHIDSVDSPHAPYNTTPPTSGPHIGRIAEWGVHKDPIPDELQVHNLEDGGVMIQYNCTDCKDLILKLEKLADTYSHVVIAPYPEMEARIALTAWQRIQTLDEFDKDKIDRFVRAYMGIDHHVGF